MKSMRRVICFVLALVLSLSLCVTAFAWGNGSINVPTPRPAPVVVEEENPFITDDHFAYIQGYPDGTFKPEGSLTRAEAATIFYRLLEDKSCKTQPKFSDVEKGKWYYTAVTTLAGKGIIDGYLDGTFKPNGNVTRAEFLKMAASFFELESANVKFTDVLQGKWYYKYIASAVAQGWVANKAADYKPNEAITRAEVVEIMNNILGREADEEYVEEYAGKLVQFSDVSAKDSFYFDVMEAANGHDFEIVKNAEIWTGLAK